MKSKGMWTFIAAGVLLISLLSGCKENTKGGDMMKFLNIEKVLVDSGLLTQEKAHLEAVKARLDAGIAMAEKRYETLSDEDKIRAVQADRQLLQLQWQAEQHQARQVVIQALKAESQLYITEHKLDALMPMDNALAVAGAQDITPEMTERLKTHTLSFRALPEVSLKNLTDEKRGEG